MILYNVTMNIDKQFEKEWLVWMKNIYLPEVMKTGMFLEFKVYRIKAQQQDGSNFSVQLFAKSMNEVVQYQSQFAAGLESRLMAKFGSNLVFFATMLESVEL